MHGRISKGLWLSRGLTLVIVALALGSLVLWQPRSWWAVALDILWRTHLMFLGTVMAHEAAHGHLGKGKSNHFWGRLALIPATVPYTNFRKTHPLHHAFTNVPDKDPDY